MLLVGEVFLGGIEPEVSREVSHPDIERNGVDGGDEEFEGVTGDDEENELPAKGLLGIDREGVGEIVGDEDDRGGVDQLTDHGRPVVTDPEHLSLGDPLPKMKDPDIAELGRHIGDHRGCNRTKCQGPDLEKDREPAGGVAEDLTGRGIDHLETGQNTTEPHDADHPDVEQKTHEDHEIRPSPAVEFADEIGAQKGDGVGQNADGDGKDQRSAARCFELEEFDEAADAQDIEHRQSTKEDAGEDQKNPLPPCVQVGGLDGVKFLFRQIHFDEHSGFQF